MKIRCLGASPNEILETAFRFQNSFQKPGRFTHRHNSTGTSRVPSFACTRIINRPSVVRKLVPLFREESTINGLVKSLIRASTVFSFGYLLLSFEFLHLMKLPT